MVTLRLQPLLTPLLLVNCVSIEQYNQKIDQPIPIEKLLKDVDFVQHKLEKLHPSLYKYISKDKLKSLLDILPFLF